MQRVNNEKKKFYRPLTLRNTYHASVEAIKSLLSGENQFDAIVLYLLTERLSYAIKKEWELELAQTQEIATFKQMDEFLLRRIKVLESMSAQQTEKHSSNEEHKFKNNNAASKKVATPQQFGRSVNAYRVTEPASTCDVCSSNHKVYAFQSLRNCQ